MTYNLDEMGARLKAARAEMGYSMEYVAEACGVKQYQTISKWESGNNTPSIDKLMKLAELYGCDIGYLLGEYDCKHRISADIKVETGLQENVIEQLRRDSFFDKDRVKALNDLLSFEDHQGGILGLVKLYLYHNYTGLDIDIGNGLTINGNTVADTLLLEIISELRALREKVQGGANNG